MPFFVSQRNTDVLVSYSAQTSLNQVRKIAHGSPNFSFGWKNPFDASTWSDSDRAFGRLCNDQSAGCNADASSSVGTRGSSSNLLQEQFEADGSGSAQLPIDLLRFSTQLHSEEGHNSTRILVDSSSYFAAFGSGSGLWSSSIGCRLALTTELRHSNSQSPNLPLPQRSEPVLSNTQRPGLCASADVRVQLRDVVHLRSRDWGDW